MLWNGCDKNSAWRGQVLKHSYPHTKLIITQENIMNGRFFCFFSKREGDGLLVTVWAQNLTRTKQTTYIWIHNITLQSRKLKCFKTCSFTCSVMQTLLAKYMVGSMIKLLIIDFKTIIMYVVVLLISPDSGCKKWTWYFCNF